MGPTSKVGGGTGKGKEGKGRGEGERRGGNGERGGGAPFNFLPPDATDVTKLHEI